MTKVDWLNQYIKDSFSKSLHYYWHQDSSLESGLNE